MIVFVRLVANLLPPRRCLQRLRRLHDAVGELRRESLHLLLKL